MSKHDISLLINGQQYRLSVESHHTLMKVLRDDLSFTGVKCACERGDCGLCTVILEGAPAKSCLVLAVEADGKEVITIEGLAKDGNLTTIQQAFLKHGAVQCGYCTPGMIMAAKALLDENQSPTEEEVKKGLGGNLCRCTGYTKIVEAVLAAADKMRRRSQK